MPAQISNVQLVERLKRECLDRLAGDGDKAAAVVAKAMLEIAAPLHEARFHKSDDWGWTEWPHRTNLEVEHIQHAIDLLKRISERQRRRTRAHRRGLRTSFPLTKAVLWEASWHLYVFWKSSYLDSFVPVELLSKECGPFDKDEAKQFEETIGTRLKDKKIHPDNFEKRARLECLISSTNFDRQNAADVPLELVMNALLRMLSPGERADVVETFVRKKAA